VTIEELKALGDTYMATAKECLAKDGALVPIVAVVKPDDSIKIVPMNDFPALDALPEQMQKPFVYGMLAIALAEVKAQAAFAINDAYSRSFKAESEEEAEKRAREYKHGDLSVDMEAKECVVVSFKGPTIPTHTLTTPYERDPLGEIVFGEPIGWIAGGSMGIIPDWW